MNSIQYDDILEGESEIKFIVDTMNYVNLWEGSFNTLMNYGNPNTNGMWSGILLTFHLHEGFYENPKWTIPSVNDYLRSLKSISVPTENFKVLTVQAHLIQLFQYALDNNLDIIVEYW